MPESASRRQSNPDNLPGAQSLASQVMRQTMHNYHLMLKGMREKLGPTERKKTVEAEVPTEGK